MRFDTSRLRVALADPVAWRVATGLQRRPTASALIGGELELAWARRARGRTITGLRLRSGTASMSAGRAVLGDPGG